MTEKFQVLDNIEETYVSRDFVLRAVVRIQLLSFFNDYANTRQFNLSRKTQIEILL